MIQRNLNYCIKAVLVDFSSKVFDLIYHTHCYATDGLV